MKKNNGLTIIIYILIFLILGVAIYMFINRNNDDNNNNVIEPIEPEEKITLEKTEYNFEITVEDSLNLKENVDFGKLKIENLNWFSNNSKIVTVHDGIIEGIKKGETDVIIQSGSIKITCHIKVNNKKVESIILDTTNKELKVGELLTIGYSILPENIAHDEIVWASSDKTICDVNNGEVLALKEGTATITATIGEVVSECQIIVKPKNVAVTGITLNETNKTITEGDSFTLTGTISPSDATNKTITWSSSDTSIATITDGTVKGLKGGTVTIEAKSNNGKTATCTVVIKSKIMPAKVPSESATKSYTSETLQYYVISKSGHYLTYIWMKDPYNQIKKLEANTANYGKIMTDKELEGQKLYRDNVNRMLSKYIDNGMIPANKGAIAFNASAFYVQGSWNPPTDYYNNRSDAWYVMQEGIVTRNNVNDLVTNRQIIGFDYNGNLKYYGSSNQLAKRQEIVDKITKDKVKNTFSFTPVLIIDRVKQPTTDPSGAKREAICQLDSNNYVMFTSKAGGNFKVMDVRDMFYDMGCINAFNLDGGGSTQMAIKNGTTVNKFLCTDGSSGTDCRSIVEGIYFVEQ